MSPSPLVSVIVPTYNRASVIGEAIDSILSQSYRPVEIVVIDDGSSDDTASRVRRYGHPVKYVYQRNRGPAAARNCGIQYAAGDFIAFCDSDDVWNPGKLEREMEIFSSYPDVDALASDSEIWRNGQLAIRSRFAQRGIVFPSDEPVSVRAFGPTWLSDSLFSTCCLTLRRRAIDRLNPGPFNPTLRAYEDWDLELRLYSRCNVLFVPSIFAQVRRSPDSTRPDVERANWARYRALDCFVHSGELPAQFQEQASAVRAELARRVARTTTSWRRVWRLPAMVQQGSNGNFRRALRLVFHSFQRRAAVSGQ